MIIARNQESVSMVRSRAKKGASRTLSTNKNFFENISLAKVLLVAVLIVVSVVIYGSYTAIQTVLSVPVSQVNVEGDLQYLNQDDVHKVINNYVVNGFITVDLKKLRAELLLLPWIQKASVKRQMPDGLLVTLIEQKPVAFWNDDGMINEIGEVFFPSKLVDIKEIPHLHGKNHATVLAIFSELQKLLPVEHQPIISLTVTETNIVNVTINSGATLIFNGADMLEKLNMWKTISSSELGRKLQEVEYIDLRYSNGAAVKWKASEKVNSKTMASEIKNGK